MDRTQELRDTRELVLTDGGVDDAEAFWRREL